VVRVAGLREFASRGEVSQGRFAALRARTSSTLDTPHHDQGKTQLRPEPLRNTATIQGIASRGAARVIRWGWQTASLGPTGANAASRTKARTSTTQQPPASAPAGAAPRLRRRPAGRFRYLAERLLSAGRPGHPLPNHLAERTHHQADQPVNHPADSHLRGRYRPTDRHRPNDPASTQTALPPIAGCSTDSAQKTGIGPTSRQPTEPRHCSTQGPPPGPTQTYRTRRSHPGNRLLDRVVRVL